MTSSVLYLLKKQTRNLIGMTSSVRETENESYGKTGAFWMKYINLMHIYHNFTRSAGTGDSELYIACLPEITNLFFAFNHVNYARWPVKYYGTLMKPHHTHAEVYKEFRNGWFVVKRTTKPFSSTPIDLTLEQTINADAGSQRLGISLIPNSISTRQRWPESHFLRTTIISLLLETLNLKRKEDISQYLKYCTMVKDNKLLLKVIGLIRETINPFTQNKRSPLVNSATVEGASPGTKQFLLNFQEYGAQKRLKFVAECIEKPERSEDRIEKQKL